MAATIAVAMASISSVEKPSEENEALLRSNSACFAALSIVPNSSSIKFRFLSLYSALAGACTERIPQKGRKKKNDSRSKTGNSGIGGRDEITNAYK